METKHPLDRQGVRAEIIAAMGVTQQVISNWKSRGTPASHCLAVEVATKGKVTRQELRPTDYWLIWPDLPQAPANIAQAAIKPVAEQGA